MIELKGTVVRIALPFPVSDSTSSPVVAVCCAGLLRLRISSPSLASRVVAVTSYLSSLLVCGSVSVLACCHGGLAAVLTAMLSWCVQCADEC